MTAPQSGKKMQEEFKRSPYAGIFGVALIVGGIGFVFTAKRNNDPTQQTLE